MQTYLLTVLQRQADAAQNAEFLRTWRPVRPRSSGGDIDIVELIGEQRRERDRRTLGSLPVRRLLARIRALAANATAYDAAHLALAEQLDAPLVTLDGKLARVPGSSARVDVLGRAEPRG